MRLSFKDMKSNTENFCFDQSKNFYNKAVSAAPAPVPAAPMGPAASAADILQHDIISAPLAASAAPLPASDDVLSAADPGALSAAPGDVMQAEVVSDRDTLPAFVLPHIKEMLTDYCSEYNIQDPHKMPGRVWRGFCLYVGQWVKASRLLFDEEKLKRQGGEYAYIPQRVEALFNIWQAITTAHDKTPLPHDFAAFAGVSIDYLLERQKGVTSASIDLRKKITDTMQAGLLAHGADGRSNSIFDIFLLKSKFGYVETSQVIHTAAASSVGAESLPLLGGPGGNDNI